MPPTIPPKPFKSYEELLDLLTERGMQVEDKERALRKLSQVGYYRLSGFWYPCREICFKENGEAEREINGSSHRLKRYETFIPGTSFDSVFSLYLLDKKLRLLVFDALERIEVHVRSVIAHELGKISPLAYTNDEYIRAKFKKMEPGKQSTWDTFLVKQQNLIDRSKEDYIIWHRETNKSIPFWVVVETWDFGMLNWYYRMLKSEYQAIICRRIDAAIIQVLGNWLDALNTLRNECAHHSRIWNMRLQNKVKLISAPYFDGICPEDEQKHKIIVCISIIWYLLHAIGPSSRWIYHVDRLFCAMPTLPNCSLLNIGCKDKDNFPMDIFMSLRVRGKRKSGWGWRHFFCGARSWIGYQNWRFRRASRALRRWLQKTEAYSPK